ncbi:hypothetical protein [Natronorarus salvus]|uniref:hypothetical protein n=1 Tax=Natronorarus salvus TaxID=3117733 RepID=UPI002F265ECA
MTFDIVGTLTQGVSRTTARNGALFVGLFFLVGTVDAVLFGGPTGGQVDGTTLVDLSPGVAVLASLLLTVATVVLYVGAIRTFVTDETEEVPTNVFTRNLPLALINFLIAGIVFAIVVGIGFLLLVIPGLFLLTALFFFDVYVLVEDDDFLASLQNSWALTGGHRLRLFALGVLYFVIVGALGIAFGVPGLVLGPTLGTIVAEIGVAITGVLGPRRRRRRTRTCGRSRTT